MNDLITRFLNNFSQWHEVTLTTIKAIIAIGIMCLVAYLLSIGYIPSEISFGDTLVFLLIRWRVTGPMPKGPIRTIGAKVRTSIEIELSETTTEVF